MIPQVEHARTIEGLEAEIDRLNSFIKWENIETAPKDGTEFISFNPNAQKRKFHVTHWCEIGSSGRWEDSRCQSITPLAWIAIPKEPEFCWRIK